MLKKLAYYAYSLLEIIFHVKNWPFVMLLLFRKSASGEHLVKLRRPPVRMTVRGAMDVWAVKETFLDAFYTRYGTPIQDGWTVVDIGAGIGDFCIYSAYGNPNTVIYAFEPFSESYHLLIKNLVQNAVENVIAFQEAVWSQGGRLVLDLSEGEPLKIASRKTPLTDENKEAVTVEALALQTVMERLGINIVDLLKLDCEGAEYEILMEASSITLSKIKRIIMEYHDVDDVHHHGQLIPFLESEGYQVAWHKNVVHDDIGYLYAERFEK